MVDLQETIIENREMVQPNHANNLGTTHGGNVLKWMDEVGALAAMRFAGQACVTAHINQVDFDQPIEVGETAFIRAYVYQAGKTSIRVRIQASAEDPLTGDREETTESYFVYVAIDENHAPSSVPELELQTAEEESLQKRALAGEET